MITTVSVLVADLLKESGVLRKKATASWGGVHIAQPMAKRCMALAFNSTHRQMREREL
jgi:hypothetical protein